MADLYLTAKFLSFHGLTVESMDPGLKPEDDMAGRK